MKLQTINQVETMSSTQLAEILGYEKKEVNRKIKDMFSAKIDGGIISPSKDNRGYVTDYHLPELESKMFVAKHDINYLEQITQFWIDNKNQTPKLPQTFAEALQLAADQARQLELQAPKVEFVDRYVESTGNKTFREVAKLLQANERTFRAMLISERIMYSLNGSWVVYSPYDKKGYFHTTTGERNGHAFNTVKFTPKGVTWISEKWNKFSK